jgi:hypothetical protein
MCRGQRIVNGEKISCPCGVGHYTCGSWRWRIRSEEGFCICFEYSYSLGLSLMSAGAGRVPLFDMRQVKTRSD